jgi:uncharacterized protein YdgA (DUF945 family)
MHIPTLVAHRTAMGPFTLDMKMRNFDIESWAQLDRLSPAPGEQVSGEFVGQIMEIIPKLLAKSPEIDISRLRLETPFGRADVTASAAFNGQPPLELAGVSLPTVLSRLRVKLDFAVDEALAKEMAALSVAQRTPAQMSEEDATTLRKAQADRMLSAMTTQGQLRKDGSRYVLEFRMENGNVQVNGTTVADLSASNRPPPRPSR